MDDAHATVSTSKECLLYRPVDNRLSRGSFSSRPRPELNKDFLSRVRQCSDGANERGTAALLVH